MRNIFITLILAISFSITAIAQESDYNLIEKTLHFYLDGDLVDDFEVIQKGFHKNADMKSISSRTGEYRESNALEVFKKAKKRTVPKKKYKK